MASRSPPSSSSRPIDSGNSNNNNNNNNNNNGNDNNNNNGNDNDNNNHDDNNSISNVNGKNAKDSENGSSNNNNKGNGRNTNQRTCAGAVFGGNGDGIGRVVTLHPSNISYEIVKKLGSGNYATVYLARRSTDGEYVAVKVMKRKEGDDRWEPRTRRELRFLDEYGKRVPDIPSLLDQEWADKDTVLIAMQLANAGTLRSVLVEHQRLSEDVARFFFFQLLNNITNIAEAGYIHRDLKPENLMLSVARDAGGTAVVVPTKEELPYATLFIVDFGFTRCVINSGDQDDDDDELDRQEFASETQTTALQFGPESHYGTPVYQAPEVLTGRPYDCRADLFSAGVILFEMVTGRLPFRSSRPNVPFTSVYEIFARQKKGVDWPDDVVVSQGLKAVVEGLLKVDPEDRMTHAVIMQSVFIRETKFMEGPSPMITAAREPRRDVPWTPTYNGHLAGGSSAGYPLAGALSRSMMDAAMNNGHTSSVATSGGTIGSPGIHGSNTSVGDANGIGGGVAGGGGGIIVGGDSAIVSGSSTNPVFISGASSVGSMGPTAAAAAFMAAGGPRGSTDSMPSSHRSYSYDESPALMSTTTEPGTPGACLAPEDLFVDITLQDGHLFLVRALVELAQRSPGQRMGVLGLGMLTMKLLTEIPADVYAFGEKAYAWRCKAIYREIHSCVEATLTALSCGGGNSSPELCVPTEAEVSDFIYREAMVIAADSARQESTNGLLQSAESYATAFALFCILERNGKGLDEQDSKHTIPKYKAQIAQKLKTCNLLQ